MAAKKFQVGVVGATGAVGAEMIRTLHTCQFPVSELHLFASQRSAGQTVKTPFGEREVELFSVEAAREMDFVFLAVSGSFAKEHAPAIAAEGGAIVIDNSSAFRYDDAIPLIVPEINPEQVKDARLIANPNCTTAILAVALWPLHQAYGVQRVIVSTYQAASGAGVEGMTELNEGTASALAGKAVQHEVFAHPLSFNVIPHIDEFQGNGYTREEMKVVWETQKIFNNKEMAISCTAVRVPTLRAHAEAITIETAKPIDPAAARELLQNVPGVKVVDDPAKLEYPMPLNATEKDDVEVGRIRQSLVFGEHGLDFFVCGDQILKGAALNAVQIAELMV